GVATMRWTILRYAADAGLIGMLALAAATSSFGQVRTGASAGNEREHADQAGIRSEEHTSELQSLTNLVCRLLLEKKKQPTPIRPILVFFFCLTPPHTPEPPPLSLHDALPISE